ncbi:metallophosphoesterase [Parapedobacter lycopersici]|uniref:metallophosphoesterase n=1 Tax=Parapedobacter lycopersici TaxID=1864939 RepID=UPI00214D7C89|nr:metallophosphoesterase [Parapedobacter lycopersici]
MLEAKLYKVILAVACVIGFHGAMSQERSNETVADWWLWPGYTLTGKAQNIKAQHGVYPVEAREALSIGNLSYTLFGANPTGSISEILPEQGNPDHMKAFTVEMWLINHVNHPIGAAVSMRRQPHSDDPLWLLGYYDDQVIFSLDPGKPSSGDNRAQYTIDGRGWKNRWWHIVGTYDGRQLCLYLNGAKVFQKNTAAPETLLGDRLTATGYLAAEPYMEVGDLLKNARLTARALTEQEIAGRFSELKRMVEAGKLLPEAFHFNAGPYLNQVTTESATLVWETDRPATVVVRYGETLPLTGQLKWDDQQYKAESDFHIGKAALTGLKPGTPYFYEIEAVADAGDTLTSGVLTFQTEPETPSSISFGVIGDTEARPHINNRIAKLLWGERPDFVLHTGDITDGGTQANKYEWNYEYFTGMGQLLERLPVYPVAGNGEGDLFWYRQYHTLPSPDGYYHIRYGDAEFFMLNSNNPGDFAPSGAQYQWLEKQLAASTARWKFVAHHHALYSADDDDYGDSWSGKSTLGDTVLQQIVPLYEKYGVDIVFYGHLHTYQRTYPLTGGKVDHDHGVVYVQTGGAGGNLEDFTPNRAWFSAKTYRGHHYVTVSISGNHLNLRMYDAEGRLKDDVDYEQRGVEGAR